MYRLVMMPNKAQIVNLDAIKPYDFSHLYNPALQNIWKPHDFNLLKMLVGNPLFFLTNIIWPEK